MPSLKKRLLETSVAKQRSSAFCDLPSKKFMKDYTV